MGFGKKFLFLLTALFLLVAVYAGQREGAPDGFLSVDVFYGDRTENIACWEEDGNYYLFLPGSAEPDWMQLRFGGEEPCLLNGQPLTDRMSCSAFAVNVPYELIENGERLGNLIFLQSDNIGAVFVDVASGSMDHIHEVKGNEETGTLRVYTPEGVLNHNGNITKINGRGNSSWSYGKKSYSVELPIEADLLAMGRAKKWILMSNGFDNSNLRNKMVYTFAREFGLAFSPDSEWIDLYLNGEYAGLYLLCERNEIHPQRVDIPREGSFLVARDSRSRFKRQGIPYIEMESRAALRMYDNDWDLQALTDYWQSVENAILAEDGIDPLTGKAWTDLIDLDSWARKYLIDEVFGNVDGTTLSQFYYYDSSDGSGKVHAGPVWDYDLSMLLNEDYPQESVEMFFANVPNANGALWPSGLYRKQEFLDRVVQLYETEFCPLLDTYLQTVIPRYAQQIAGAAEMNSIRWGVPCLEENLETIYRFLTMRKVFLDDVWLQGTEYCYINAITVDWSRNYYAVKPGSLPPGLLYQKSNDPDYEYRWYRMDDGTYFSLEEPVYQDVEIVARYERITEEEPEETSEQPEEEPQASEIAEPIPASRLLPAAAFLLLMLLVSLAGLYRTYFDK